MFRRWNCWRSFSCLLYMVHINIYNTVNICALRRIDAIRLTCNTFLLMKRFGNIYKVHCMLQYVFWEKIAISEKRLQFWNLMSDIWFTSGLLDCFECNWTEGDDVTCNGDTSTTCDRPREICKTVWRLRKDKNCEEGYRKEITKACAARSENQCPVMNEVWCDDDKPRCYKCCNLTECNKDSTDIETELTGRYTIHFSSISIRFTFI